MKREKKRFALHRNALSSSPQIAPFSHPFEARRRPLQLWRKEQGALLRVTGEIGKKAQLQKQRARLQIASSAALSVFFNCFLSLSLSLPLPHPLLLSLSLFSFSLRPDSPGRVDVLRALLEDGGDGLVVFVVGMSFFGVVLSCRLLLRERSLRRRRRRRCIGRRRQDAGPRRRGRGRHFLSLFSKAGSGGELSLLLFRSGVERSEDWTSGEERTRSCVEFELSPFSRSPVFSLDLWTRREFLALSFFFHFFLQKTFVSVDSLSIRHQRG